MLLLLCKNRAKQQLTAISVNVEKIYTDNFNYTLQALAYTLIVVLPIPLFIYYLGWFLSSNIHVADFTRAIGEGLQERVNTSAFPAIFLSSICMMKVLRVNIFNGKKTTRVCYASKLPGYVLLRYLRYLLSPAQRIKSVYAQR